MCIVQRFRKQGVPMLAGSALGGIGCIPGFSLQQEFALMKSIGFCPLEVLQTTALRRAEFLNRTDSMGTVDVGKSADLVLLDADRSPIPPTSRRSPRCSWRVAINRRRR